MNDGDSQPMHTGGYAIYQMTIDSQNERLLFASYDEATKIAGSINRQRYELIYADVLHYKDADPMRIAEDIYSSLNENRPADFHGHSPSVSDVIVLRLEGQSVCLYVDRIGFRQLEDFFSDQSQRHSVQAQIYEHASEPGHKTCNNGRKKHEQSR